MDRTKALLLLIGLALIIAVAAILIFGVRRGPEQQISGDLTLWGVFDPPSVINQLINDYRRQRPRVNIRYEELDPRTYEQDLLNALATPTGPDFFMFRNSWLPKHFDKLAPLTNGQLTIGALRDLFPTVVEQDFAPDGIIYALPLYIDTLTLFYNRDTFDTKAVANPPKTWLEFQDLIPKLVEFDKTGRISKPAAAIGGTARSINRATDILNLLMLQSGVEMVDENFTRAAFGFDGLDSLNFYTQFANSRGSYYTWSDSLPYSIDSFAEGKIAMMFNYSHQIAALKEKNPFLNFGVSAIPQPSQTEKIVNYPSYWGLAVSAKSPNAVAAWDFISFLTANSETSRRYLQTTGKPPALRTLIASYSNDPTLGIFARQALSARSWPQIDSNTVENIFSKMIENVIIGRVAADEALKRAENEITALMQKRRS